LSGLEFYGDAKVNAALEAKAEDCTFKANAKANPRPTPIVLALRTILL